ADDGSIYALGLSDAVAVNRPQPAAADAAATTTTTTEEAAATQQAQATQTARSRNELINVRSAVFRILNDGGTDIVWSSTSITGFALLTSRNGVLLGTSDKGRIYSITDDGRDTLLLQSPEGQISAMVARGADVFAASSNQGKLFRYSDGRVTEGTYESPVRDAKLASTWGRVWWRGQGP